LSQPLASTLDEYLAQRDWFADVARPQGDSPVPPVIVMDDFYPDPHAVRDAALGSKFAQYIPPDPAIVGEELAASNAHRQGRWLSTAFVTYHGQIAADPFFGSRHNPDWLRQKLEEWVGEPIVQASWDSSGDYWNGAFHLVERGFGVGEGVIHHHYKPGDLEGRGWSGVVYLSPDAPPSAGTSFWRNRSTGKCVASFDERYHYDPAEFELAYVAENRFNRAVLFRENIWHRVEHGLGEGAGARLTQTLFFETTPSNAG
jgi:hypothetical protein